jgi:hypothetical protein
LQLVTNNEDSRILALLESYHDKERRGEQDWAIGLSQIDQRRTLVENSLADLAVLYPNIKHLL